MKYKDLPDGKAFQFSPDPGERESAIKAGAFAYSLRTGERLTIHPNRNCEELRQLTGDGYRLGVVGQNSRLVIFSQGSDTSYFVHDFLVIGHIAIPKDAVKPIVGKAERAERAKMIDIILNKLDEQTQKTENLLKVLRDELFEDFSQIKLT